MDSRTENEVVSEVLFKFHRCIEKRDLGLGEALCFEAIVFKLSVLFGPQHHHSDS